MKRNYDTLKLLALYLLFLLTLILFSACGPYKPDYVKDGKEYAIISNCAKSHSESDYDYHYGYNFMSGKYEYHWGLDEKEICDSVAYDTVEINLKEKYYANNR